MGRTRFAPSWGGPTSESSSLPCRDKGSLQQNNPQIPSAGRCKTNTHICTQKGCLMREQDR